MTTNAGFVASVLKTPIVVVLVGMAARIAGACREMHGAWCFEVWGSCSLREMGVLGTASSAGVLGTECQCIGWESMAG